jgi:hypothetical protein
MMQGTRISRRTMLGSAAGMAVAGAGRPESGVDARHTPAPDVSVAVSADADDSPAAFDPAEAGFVGLYDVDWLIHPEFTLLLDNLAASPRAFRGVRFFGVFTAGTPEDFLPETGGEVWGDANEPIDFTTAFDALEALTSRGLIPFISLGFFPQGVSDSPITPPANWDRWQHLVRTFFRELADDDRFGEATIADWWFEVWNEPNEGRFWSGTREQYFELYRVTSEVVSELDLPIRLGGPAIAYKPQEDPAFGVPWMDRFFRFIAADPALRLDFVSIHRKGTVGSDPPDPRRLHEAAVATADQMLAIDPVRFSGVPVINNEADEKVGFEVPYAPRMHEAGAAWLGAVTAIHAGLDGQYLDAGMRFMGAADNINLQLVEEPFDGRRSIMTRAGSGETELVKVPAYAFYELLPMMGGRLGQVISGRDAFFPATDLYHLVTVSNSRIGCMVTSYPDPDGSREIHRLEYTIEDIPWESVNVAQFRIDREHSNAYRAAGGSDEDPFPAPEREELKMIRQAQELTVVRPIERGVEVSAGTLGVTLELEPYATAFLWITPSNDDVPAPPEWLSVEQQGKDEILRWTPNPEPSFFSYEVFVMDGAEPGERITPDPMRAALWIDTSPPTGVRTYGVRSVSASGVTSPMATSREIRVRG